MPPPSLSLRNSVALLAMLSAPAAAQTVPAGFVVEDLFPTASFVYPVDLEFLPDGRALVAQVQGVVHTLLPDGTQYGTPFLDLGDELQNGGDLGLLGLAADPDFATNRWVYLAYVVDPNEDGVDDEEDRFCRITRYRTSLADPNVADPTTRQVLLGATWSEGSPVGSTSHSIGGLRFGADKTLLVASGDGGHFTHADSGGVDPGLFGAGKTDPAEDLGAFRALTLNSLAGKMLRLDKETGLGLPSNPYWDGDATSDRSKVWLYGLRNPWRFSVRPGTGSPNPADADPGVLYIGDVGDDAFEELIIADTPGANFGWPCHEGPAPHPVFPTIGSTAAGNTNVLCSASPSAENPTAPTGPDLWWHHFTASQSNPVGWIGTAVTGGVFAGATSYPAPLGGSYFLADWTAGWIRAVQVDATDNITGWSEFASGLGGPVDLEIHPGTGDLVYVSLFDAQVLRIRNTVGTAAPVADLPASFRVAPNPFRGTTSIRYSLPAASRVRVRIFDVDGRWIQDLASGNFEAGTVQWIWDGRDSLGRPQAPGVYFVRVETDRGSFGEKVVLIR